MKIELQKHIDELIASYLADTLSAEERVELFAWIRESPENEAYFMRYQEIWLSSKCVSSQLYDASKAFSLFKERVTKVQSQADNLILPLGKKRSVFIQIYKYAAAIIILGIVSCFSFYWGEHTINKSLAQIEVEAPLGSFSRVLLPDSTVVVLNGGSHLTYAQNFGIENRHVTLVGEGYFEVTRNELKPFCVSSQGVQVTVLGTRFNVQNYKEDSFATISLLEGKVVLQNELKNENLMELIPGDRVELDKRSGVLYKENVKEVSEDKSWTQGSLIFNEAPLTEVIKSLSRSYGIQLTIQNKSLNDVCVYGHFNRTLQSIGEVLDILGATERIRYKKISEKEIILY